MLLGFCERFLLLLFSRTTKINLTKKTLTYNYFLSLVSVPTASEFFSVSLAYRVFLRVGVRFLATVS